MFKTLYRSLTIIVALTLTLNGVSNAGASPAKATANPMISLAYFYKPPINMDVVTLGQNFNTYVLTHGDETYRNQLIANGIQSPILQYVSFEVIMDPGSCTSTPWKSQVAYKAGDFCSISQNHPDWFLLDANGNRLSDGGFYFMDPGNAGWRQFWVTRALEMQQLFGWNGVFIDNVEASLAKHQNAGRTLKLYPTDASYQTAVLGFLQYMYTGYFHPQGRPLYANIISIKNVSTWFAYIPYLDGAMQEGWAVDWSSGYLSQSYWLEDLALAEQTQAMGKQAILVSQGASNDSARQAFAFGSYLLVMNGKASFRYGDDKVYNEAWLYSNYNVDLGAPLGARYQSGNLWRRDFTNGYVSVDPINHTADISTTPPAPTTFSDVPASHWAAPWIEAIYQAEITSGCGGGKFCPENGVSRAEMAVFLLRAEHGNSFTPVAASGLFTDVPANYWAAAWIEQLAREGITSGCSNGNYCPEGKITRAQLAIFILRVTHGSQYTLPSASGSMFSDIKKSYWAASWIEQFAREGITNGCGGGNYCPDDVVTRAQMAVFIARAFALPIP
jgi:hypothetical protein